MAEGMRTGFDRGKPQRSIVSGPQPREAVELGVERSVRPIQRMAVAAAGVRLPELHDQARHRLLEAIDESRDEHNRLALGPMCDERTDRPQILRRTGQERAGIEGTEGSFRLKA